MVNKEHIMLLNDELKKILQLELQAGNIIAETAICGFSKTEPNHLFVFLEKPFLTPIQKNMPGITYTEVNDAHYWKAETAPSWRAAAASRAVSASGETSTAVRPARQVARTPSTARSVVSCLIRNARAPAASAASAPAPGRAPVDSRAETVSKDRRAHV